MKDGPSKENIENIDKNSKLAPLLSKWRGVSKGRGEVERGTPK